MNTKKAYFFKNILIFLLLFLSVMYFTQILSPLRLNFDGVDFLRMAISWEQLGNIYPDVSTTRYPSGYPLLLGFLLKLGILNSSSIVLVNLLFLACSLLVFWFLSRRVLHFTSESTVLLLCGVMLSWILVKHITLPLSDVPFLGVSFISLFCLVKAELAATNRRWVIWFATSVAGCFISISFRHVGFCLIPAILWLVYKKISGGLSWNLKLDRLLLKIGLFVCLLLFIFLSLGADVLPMPDIVRSVYSHESILPIAFQRVGDLGCALLNINLHKIPFKELFKPVAIGLGVFILFACIKILFQKDSRVSVIWIYLVTYLGLIFVAPWNDPRYLLPVWPLLLLALIKLYSDLHTNESIRILPMVGVTWFVGYASLGFLALGYSTWLTFSGPKFANRYGSKESKEEYLYFYGGRSLEETKSNPRAYEMYKLLDYLEPSSKGILKDDKIEVVK
jgi:hypothetical protein